MNIGNILHTYRTDKPLSNEVFSIQLISIYKCKDKISWFCIIDIIYVDNILYTNITIKINTLNNCESFLFAVQDAISKFNKMFFNN